MHVVLSKGTVLLAPQCRWRCGLTRYRSAFASAVMTAWRMLASVWCSALRWSVRVSGNWRVVFRFEDGEAVDVDLIDYH